MYVPAARERVRIQGRAEAFLVLAVNREDQLAYLIDLQRESTYVETVRFDQLLPIDPAPASLQTNAAD